MTLRIVSIGEAMVELAPVDDGLYRRGFAGDTFNTLWHIAQLLGDRAQARYVTRVGSDRTSEQFVTEMAADGLDISGVVHDPQRTMGLYLIELDGAERSFQYWRGQSAARHLADDRGALADSVRDADLIHLSGITLAILAESGRRTLFEILGEARRTGTKVSFDPNYRPKLWSSPEETRATTISMLSHADIVVPSFDDERTLWGDPTPRATVERYQDHGMDEIIVKDGAESVHVRANGAFRVIETAPARTVLDTSGAGDAFNAGYLAARMTGAAPEAAVAFAQSVSREVLAHPGARLPRPIARSLALPPAGAAE